MLLSIQAKLISQYTNKQGFDRIRPYFKHRIQPKHPAPTKTPGFEPRLINKCIRLLRQDPREGGPHRNRALSPSIKPRAKVYTMILSSDGS